MREEKMFYVYIMASRSRKLYIGATSEIEHRVSQHKNHVHEGFTDKYNCTRLVYLQRFGEASAAITRETQLKKWRREKKDALIHDRNPTWEDLSEGWGKPTEPYVWPEETAGSSAPSAAADSGRNDTFS